MSDQPPPGMSGNHDQRARTPLFDPYTGKRLQPETAPNAMTDGTGPSDTGPGRADPPTASPQKKRRGRALPILVALVALAIIGGVIWYVTGPRADAQAKETARENVAAAKRAETERASACEDLLEASYKSLRSIDSRLNVGMVEGDYTEAVGNAQSEFDLVDSDDVERNKCGSYEDLADALTQYAAAATYWNDCITGDYCTVDESKLQGYWSDVTITLDAVKINGLGVKAQGEGA